MASYFPHGIAAQDAALGRAQLSARLAARAVLDPAQRTAVEHATPPATRRPRIKIGSSIAGSVYIDGQRVGDTPVTTTVSPGSHELRLDAPGYDSLTKHFDLGESGEMVLELEPQRRRSTSTSTSISSPSSSSAPAPAPSPSATPGHLTLTTQPWTTIYLDGKPLGRTPIKLTLTPGRHDIQLVGQDQRTRKTLTLDVTAGQQSNLSFTFDD